MQQAVANLGASVQKLVLELGHITRFAGWILRAVFRTPFRVRRLLQEIYETGVLSLPIIVASAITVGAVLGLQLHIVLSRFGAESSLGGVISVVLIRELGPVLAGLLTTGRAGSAMSAEIGMMTATEQIDGMRTLAVDPVHYVVAPKFLAMLIVMPLLNAIFVVCAIFGAWLIGVQMRGVDSGVFVSGLEEGVDFGTDVVGSCLKALVFGLVIALVAAFRGFTTGRSAIEVSRSTTATVVTASVCILLADFVVTALWGF